MYKTINSMYFSPTGTTQKIVTGLAKTIAESIDGQISTFEFYTAGSQNQSSLL